MIVPILLLGLTSFVISWLLTALMIRIAPRIGFVDKPGHRKIHSNPKPLGGGVAIFLAFALPMIGCVILIHYAWPDTPLWRSLMAQKQIQVLDARAFPDLKVKPIPAPDNELNIALWTGARKQTPLALALTAAVFAMHVMGLWDDRRALGPYVKLFIQLAITTTIVTVFQDVRALTALGNLWSIALTVLWIVAITNAFNFLDNMDGLSSGVAAVCTTAFFVTALSIQQWFVAATLALLLGAVLGFLFWNFPPSKIFMGDSGSLIIGFILGVLTVRTTYLLPGQQFAAGWYSVFAPVIVLAVPLYDLIVVSIIRISRGKSPFVGDTNHFSHRLVARGMSRRMAVLCIYLVTASTAIAAILLPHVQSTFGAILIFSQTLLVLGVVALLEQHPLPASNGDKT